MLSSRNPLDELDPTEYRCEAATAPDDSPSECLTGRPDTLPRNPAPKLLGDRRADGLWPKGAIALELALVGFRVFPVSVDDPKLSPKEIKRPAVTQWQEKSDH